VGLLDDWEKSATIAAQRIGNVAMLFVTSTVLLGQSLWLREIANCSDGTPPPVDLDQERKNGEFIRQLIDQETVDAVHDISDGGMLVALAEMALAGGAGVTINPLDLNMPSAAFAFGEEQGRYLVSTESADRVRALASKAGVEAEIVAVFNGSDELRWFTTWREKEWSRIALADLRAAHEGFFPRLMGADAALA